MNHFDLFNKHYIIGSAGPRQVTITRRKSRKKSRGSYADISLEIASLFEIAELEGDLEALAMEVLVSFRDKEEETEEGDSYSLAIDADDLLKNQEMREELTVVKDIETSANIVIERATGNVSPVHIDSYVACFSSKEWSSLRPTIPPRILRYDVGGKLPDTETVISETGRKTYKTANSYCPPEWFLSFDNKIGKTLHPDHKTMIESRFLDAESLERFYCSLYHMITARNKTIVGLIHKRQGTGKSTVLGGIPRALVGQSNFANPDGNFIRTQHKDILLNKRAILLDEAVIYRSDITRMKQMTEPLLYINGKGTKAVTVPNNISWFLASNTESDIYTEPGDRRYCFLEDSGKKIDEIMGTDWMDSYTDRLINDAEFIANLGYYILNEFSNPRYAADAIYKGATFERIVRATARANFSDIIDSLLSSDAEEVDYYSSKRSFKKEVKFNGGRSPNYPNHTEFADFFKAVRWKGEPICEVIQAEGEVNPVLKPV